MFHRYVRGVTSADAGVRDQPLIREMTGWAATQLGSVELIADHSGPHRRAAVVLEFEGRHGSRWIAKRPVDGASFRRELRAYQDFVPQLGDRAPHLEATSEQHRILLLSVLQGRGAEAPDLRGQWNVHRRAGALLARLHATSPPQPSPGLGAALGRRVTRLVARNPDLLDAPTVDYLARLATRVMAMTDLQAVPCHLDYTQRNWLVDAGGQLRVLDFSTSERALPAQDFSRLANRQWTHRPELRDAFFVGYGRALSPVEQEQLEICTAFTAAQSVLRARTVGSDLLAAQSLATLARLQDPGSRRQDLRQFAAASWNRWRHRSARREAD